MVASSSNYTTTFGWLCPLYSFEFDVDLDSVDLTDGIRIQRLTQGFANFLREYYSHDWDIIECVSPGHTKYMVFLPSNAEYDGKIAPFREVSEKSALLFDLITALRLCQVGDLIPGPFIYGELRDAETFKPVMPLSVWLFTNVLAPVCRTNIGVELLNLRKYDFRQSDIPCVSSLLDRLGACRRAGRPQLLPDGKTKILKSVLDEALSRFNSAYQGEPTDRLIDQMIAFEFLYVGDYKELAYKLALRTAFLLTRDQKEREVIFADMKKAYDLRSKIVHGNKQIKTSELYDIISKAEEYLRQSIRKFLALLPHKFSLEDIKVGKAKMLAKLDENILSNGELLN
jgi:hypothetical protein